MTETKKPAVGTFGWFDLTVADVPKVRDFYKAVVGWEAYPVDMGGYEDFSIGPPDGEPVGGLCHARGPNTALPPVWLLYIIVANLEESAKKVVELGGKLITPTRPIGEGKFCVIQDPAGATCALYQL